MPELSIVTASHRNLAGLEALYAQLKPALGENVEWIIKDSGKCEATRTWGDELSNPNVRFICEADNGIYPALNRALSECRAEFYLVVGSDDFIDPASVHEVARLIQTEALKDVDVASFPVIINQKVFHRKLMCPTFLSVGGLVSSHSVGTVIRRSLHDSIGLYDEDYKILADSYFLRRAYQAGASFRHFKGPVMGTFTQAGISSTQHARRIVEAYSYNVACADSYILQAILLMLRTIKYRPSTFIKDL